MVNRPLAVKLILVVVALLVAAGCRQERVVTGDVLAQGPDVEKIVVTGKYVPRAIQATGGYRAWINTKKLQADSVVTLYEPDGAFYLTEQHHDIYPWSNSIRISALEPQGPITWQLHRGEFSVLNGTVEPVVMPANLSPRHFAEAVLNITTAAVRFLDSSSQFTEAGDAVRIDGLWHYPIERIYVAEPNSTVEPCWSKAIFYLSRDNAVVDILWFAADNEGKYFVVRGYDYKETEKGGVSVPSKIEIFRSDARHAIKKRLVRIDYK